jgi:hypothetical protein
MQLPFSRSEFLDVFGAYNAALWPGSVALWAVSLALSLYLVNASRAPHRALSALLAVHWAWSAIAYHAVFFSAINPAAWVFAGAFLVEALLIAWLGILRPRLRFSAGRRARHVLAGVLVAYALAYPFVVFAEGLAYPRAPAFGVPCPTTIFTMALFLTVESLPWSVVIVPLLWAGIGGSAAFLLGVHADLMLVAAALLLIAFMVRRGAPGTRRPGRSRESL